MVAVLFSGECCLLTAPATLALSGAPSELSSPLLQVTPVEWAGSLVLELDMWLVKELPQSSFKNTPVTESLFSMLISCLTLTGSTGRGQGWLCLSSARGHVISTFRCPLNSAVSHQADTKKERQRREMKREWKREGDKFSPDVIGNSVHSLWLRL